MQIDGEHAMTPIGTPLRLQRIKRLEPPNKPAHLEQIGGLQAQIDSLQQRIIEIKSILDNRYQNRHVASPEFIAARKKLADLNATFKDVLERKRARKEELELVKEKLRGSGFRSGLPEVTVEELDEQIRKLEYRQTHTSLPIDEERRLITQIEKLKKSRDLLRRHGSRAEQDQGSRTELADLIKRDDQELNALKEDQDQQRQILADLRAKESANALDIPALLQEKNDAYETIKGLRDDIKQLKVEFSVKEDEYWKREKEWRAQQAQERKMKAEKGRAEWLEREKIRKQRALENFVEPFTDEIIMCEQLLSYMQKNVPLDEGAAAPQQQQKAKIVAPEGFGVALVSKKNRNEDELDGWFAGSGGKKGKKAKGSTAPKSKAREKISLSIDALSSFEKLKISTPATYGDVTKSIDELKLKKDELLEKQKKARELRERGENGGSHGVDHANASVSQPSGAEASLAECSIQAGENGSSDDHTAVSEKGSSSVVADGADGTPCTESVDVESSGEQDTREDLASSDSKDNTQLDDKAHLETFEFSEAHLGTEEDAHIEEQAADNGVVSVIFDCATQNGALKELSSENIKVEEPVAEVVENGAYSHSSECGAHEILASTVDETPESIKGSESLDTDREHGKREDSNGVLQVDENGKDFTLNPCEVSSVVEELNPCEVSSVVEKLNPCEVSSVDEEQVVADSAEGKVLQDGGSVEESTLVASDN